jgi:hypothetical protein
MAVGDGVEDPVAVHGPVLGLHLHAEDLSLRTEAFSHPANIHCKFELGQYQRYKNPKWTFINFFSKITF